MMINQEFKERIEAEDNMIFRWIRFILYSKRNPMSGGSLADYLEGHLFKNQAEGWEEQAASVIRRLTEVELPQGITSISPCIPGGREILNCYFDLTIDGQAYVYDDLNRIEKVLEIIDPIAAELDRIYETRENNIIALLILATFLHAYDKMPYDILGLADIPRRILENPISRSADIAFQLGDKWKYPTTKESEYLELLMGELKRELQGESIWKRLRNWLWRTWYGVHLPDLKVPGLRSYIGVFRIDMLARETMIDNGVWNPDVSFSP